MWDGAFLLARKINPLPEDVDAYRLFIDAAVKGHKDLGCTVTPKVHLMIDHVEWQMRNTVGGQGDKMEDWVERLQRFRTVRSGKDQELAITNANARDMSPSVIAQINMVNEGNKRNLTELKTYLVGELRKKERNESRSKALQYFIQGDGKRLSWSAPLFDDGKGAGGG
jgi:hypothetical protein